MVGKRLQVVCSLGFVSILSSCGDPRVPAGAVISAVEANRTTTYTLNTAPTIVVDGTIHFKIQASDTDPTPVNGANVDLSASSPTVGDTASGFVAGGLGSGFVNPGDRDRLHVTSNASGVVSANYQFTVPKCTQPPAAAGGGTGDLAVSASISASIGVSSATWIDSITIKADPTC